MHLKHFISNLANRRILVFRTTDPTVYLEKFSTTFKFQTAIRDGYIIWEDTSFLSELRQEASTVRNQIAKVAREVDPATLLSQQPGEGEKQVQQPVVQLILIVT